MANEGGAGSTWVEEEIDGLRLLRGRSAGLEVALLPEVGGKIISLRSATGREWFWQARRRPYRRLTYGAPFEEQDVSGFDKYFPGIAEGPYPESPWQGTTIPDHGELWTLPWATSLDSDTLVLRVHGIRFPYQLEKRLTLEAATATLRIDYRLTNLAPFPLHYLWSAHPLFAVRPGMRVLLPPGVKVRVDWSKHDRLGPFGSEHQWPQGQLADGTGVALDRLPATGADTADKVYTDRLPENAEAGWCALHDPDSDEYLALRFNARRVPYIGIWLNMDGWPLQPGDSGGRVTTRHSNRVPVSPIGSTAPWRAMKRRRSQPTRPIAGRCAWRWGGVTCAPAAERMGRTDDTLGEEGGPRDRNRLWYRSRDHRTLRCRGYGSAARFSGSRQAEVARLVAETIGYYGGLDILVNNAAIGIFNKTVENTTEDEWARTLAINLKSAYLVLHQAILHLRARGGRSIVNVASIHVYATTEGVAAYAASKDGVLALSRQMALDFARDNIRVNALVVRAVQTDMLRAHVEREGKTYAEMS